MSCSYFGSSSEQAQYQADICNYNDTAAKLNSISTTYNNLLNLSNVHFEDSAKYQSRARALSTIGEWGASIAIAAKAKKALKAGVDSMASANNALTAQSYVKYIARARFIIVGYRQGGSPIYEVFFDIISVNESRTYKQAIAYANDLSDFLDDYSSWSIGLSFGSGNWYFLLNENTLNTLISLTIEGAHSIGLISDSLYRKIKSSPLWQIAISLVTSQALSYGLSSYGYKNTPLGYTNKAGYDSLLGNGVSNVLSVVTTLSTIYQAYNIYQKEDESKNVKSSSSNIQDFKKYSDTDVYITGEYYKVFAGQKLFNYGLAGHDGYVPASVQPPSWGIVKEKVHDEDEFGSQIMNQNRNITMAGGSSYLNHITQGAIPLSR